MRAQIGQCARVPQVISHLLSRQSRGYNAGNEMQHTHMNTRKRQKYIYVAKMYYRKSGAMRAIDRMLLWRIF